MKHQVSNEDVENIIREALTKYETGKSKHGELDLSTDKRDFISKVEGELLDCINYCAFQILKLRKFREKGYLASDSL